jgi:hypothetical protein
MDRAPGAKMPDGYKIPPHWHPADQNITMNSTIS